MDNIPKELYSDNEQIFYSKFLSSFENIKTEEKIIEVEEELSKTFDEFAEIYFNSVSNDESVEYADSFAFFIACGVVVYKNGKYYINLEELSKKTDDYIKLYEEKGECIKKGTI